MQVKDLMPQKEAPITISPDQSFQDGMKLMADHRIGSLLVVDESQNPVGIITEHDIFRLAYEHSSDIRRYKISDYMTQDLIIGLPDDDIEYIANVITQKRIRHIPIMDENKKLCGILSIGDILKTKLEQAEIDTRYLREYIQGMPTNRR